MSTLFIQDTTLTAIADAIRTKSGGGKIVPIVEIFKSDNVNTPEDYTPGAPRGTFYQIIKIEGASELLVKLWLEFNNPSASNFMMKAGEHEQGSWNYSSADYQRSGASGTVTYEMFSFKDTDAVSLYAYNAGTNANSFGWYVEVEGYDADGNVIGEGSGTPLTYKPGEMPAAILAISGEGGGGITPEGNLDIVQNGDYDVTTYASAHVAVPVGVFPTGEKQITVNGNYDITNFATVSVEVPTGGGLPDRAYNISGDLSYRFANNGWNWFISAYGSQLNVTDVTSMANMFYGTNALVNIPFTINIKRTATLYAGNAFDGCWSLKTAPTINWNSVSPANVNKFFGRCQDLQEIPADYFDGWNWNYIYNTQLAAVNMGAMFDNCYSLREIPESLLKRMYQKPIASSYNYSYSFTCGAFQKCVNLDKIIGLYPQDYTGTYSLFQYTFVKLNCLSRLVFATQEDGTPYVRSGWKNQLIDLSDEVGYTAGGIYCTYIDEVRDSGKRIRDAETYAAYKDDPDSYAFNSAYSRYNKTSAIETINSLPDVSASGGTNTIKFKGAAGSATDGGAINTMTEAEIAVAAAKGWTVTFI